MDNHCYLQFRIFPRTVSEFTLDLFSLTYGQEYHATLKQLGVTHGPCLLFDSSLGFLELGLGVPFAANVNESGNTAKDQVPGSPVKIQR